jgi:hypothetical protein
LAGSWADTPADEKLSTFPFSASSDAIELDAASFDDERKGANPFRDNSDSDFLSAMALQESLRRLQGAFPQFDRAMLEHTSLTLSPVQSAPRSPCLT